MDMNWIDLAIIVIVGISMLTGLFRGLVKEVIALITWIVAIWLAMHYTDSFSNILTPYIKDQKIRSAMTFIDITLSVLIVGAILNAILSFIFKRAGMSGTDRLFGLGFGFLRGVLIIGLVMMIVDMTSLPVKEYRHDSVLYSKFDPLELFLKEHMSDYIQQVLLFEQNEELAEQSHRSVNHGVKDTVYSA